MTRQADFKALVRARMEKTGERYNAARRHVLEGRTPPPAPAVAAEPNVTDTRVFVGDLFQEEREGHTLLVPREAAEFGPYATLRRAPDDKVAAILAKGKWRAVTADELSYSMEVEFSSFEDYGSEHEFFS